MTGFHLAPLAKAAILGLSAVNAWLLIGIVYSKDDPLPVTVEWKPATPAPVSGGIVMPKPLDAYSKTLTLPVFFKSRAPFVPPPQVPVKAPQTPPPPVITDPGIVLGGVMMTSGVKKVYLAGKSGTDGTWVAEGEEFAGWKVQSVEEGSAKIVKGNYLFELVLYVSR